MCQVKSSIFQNWLRPASTLDGRAQLQHLEDLMEAVVPHVAQGAGAEVVPAAEDGMGIGRVIGPMRRGAQPQVPVEARGNGRLLGGRLRHALRPEGTRRPVVDFPHRADRAAGEPLAELRRRRSVGHAEELGGHAGLPGRVAGDSHLVENVGDRLVRDDVFPLPHGPDGDHSVEVLGRHDVDGVEVLFLVEHLAEVGIGPAVPRPAPCLA